MSETNLGDALRAFVAEDEPPMGLASTDVLAAGRRDRRRRRIASLGGVALAGTMLAGAAALLMSPAPRPAVADTFAPATPCAGPPGARPPGEVRADQPFTPEVADWAAANLTCHLTTTLPHLVPTARYAAMPGAPAGPLQGYWQGAEQPPWGNRVDAVALVRDANGVGDLMVSVGMADSAAAASAADLCRRRPAGGTCEVWPGSDGETILVSPAVARADGSPSEVSVEIYRGTTVISVMSSDTDRQVTAGSGAPNATRAGGPALTVDEAVKLASSPDLVLFP